ncbi:MAG: DUF2892 domain-containing protein [Planctomycetia bacterium]|nr:DUF2892 domain-containing protein [Planctomycetia bacterium]
MFVIINSTPTRINKSHLVDLYERVSWAEPHRKFASRMVGALYSEGDSPLRYRINRLGGRSQKACEKMLQAGISDVVSVEGGTAACEAAGIPVVRGRKAMSLERQVRICAGALVATGAALAAFGPDPLWQRIGMGLAGFIGCGLVFAGVTDTCGMAMLIARMPWNQSAPATVCATRPPAGR